MAALPVPLAREDMPNFCVPACKVIQKCLIWGKYDSYSCSFKSGTASTPWVGPAGAQEGAALLWPAMLMPVLGPSITEITSYSIIQLMNTWITETPHVALGTFSLVVPHTPGTQEEGTTARGPPTSHAEGLVTL